MQQYIGTACIVAGVVLAVVMVIVGIVAATAICHLLYGDWKEEVERAWRSGHVLTGIAGSIIGCVRATVRLGAAWRPSNALFAMVVIAIIICIYVIMDSINWTILFLCVIADIVLIGWLVYLIKKGE